MTDTPIADSVTEPSPADYALVEPPSEKSAAEVQAEFDAYKAAQEADKADVATDVAADDEPDDVPVGYADPDIRDDVRSNTRIPDQEQAVFLAGTGHNDA